MKILFERSAGSYLPEVTAYRRYLDQFDGVETFEACSSGKCLGAAYDVLWKFPGLLPRRDHIFTVHEYNSLSTAPFAKIKNLAKKVANARPDYRVFLNKRVRSGFKFKDEVPASIRDMGVDKSFFLAAETARNVKKEYHLVYMGSLTKSRGVHEFVKSLVCRGINLKILLVGEPERGVFDEFRGNKDIVFTGRVDQSVLPDLALSAIAGLNFIPDVYPYNIQTSTKLIEYCALGIGVVSSHYSWVDEFVRERDGRFFWLNRGGKVTSASMLEKFDFRTPSVNDLEWNAVIERSGVFENVFSAVGFSPLRRI
ncbi:hypothetical protein [Thalassospira tepidiphila]|jgi:glycosyltransferase involved in cell wall biosynthesis|uniref:hypothetical protein n=1 Tax=Thalassospira tepidiphila TaxID=393657 RepID=UPI00291F59B7|nr:hypothetical protein MACH01_31220 [Thalassospira tepidiphila]